MNIIGISAYYHDSACCLLRGGSLVYGALEERFTGIKHDASFPINAFRNCLFQTGINISNIDYVAYFEIPEDKLSRQLWMGLSNISEYNSLDINRLNPNKIKFDLSNIIGYDGPILFFPHHMAHASNSFHYSGFSQAAIFTVDSVGEWTTTSYGIGNDTDIEIFEKVEFPNSLGLLYSTVVNFLGFSVNSEEYKVMGLAPYGSDIFKKQIYNLIRSKPKGQFDLDLKYFNFSSTNKMYTPLMSDLFNFQPRKRNSEIQKFHMDLACSLQNVIEEILLEKSLYLYKLTKTKKLCLSGGVALNCVANGKISRLGPFEEVFIPPAPGDSGNAIGAATLAHIQLTKKKSKNRPIKHNFIGPSFTTEYIIKMLKLAEIEWLKYDDYEELYGKISVCLASGKVVGWFQGRMEFGPRALGARSILADPRNPKMRDKVNSLVKKRELFRPFAPVVLESHADKYFEGIYSSPFMTKTFDVLKRDELPATTHIDGTARVQTVSGDSDNSLVGLLNAFYKETNCPVLLNTSFNLQGEPIVCTPQDALSCFIRSGIEILVLENIVISKENISIDHEVRLKEFNELVQLAKEIKISQDVYTLI